MYYQCHKVSFICGGSYIHSVDWIKETINPENKDDTCFRYATTFALNHEKFESHAERVSNIKPFMNKHNWKEINYPSKIDD